MSLTSLEFTLQALAAPDTIYLLANNVILEAMAVLVTAELLLVMACWSIFAIVIL